jgi:hypothetical protein
LQLPGFPFVPSFVRERILPPGLVVHGHP